MAGKRHLTVLQASPPADENDVPRPPWQWAGFAAMLMLPCWAILAAIVPFAAKLVSSALGNDTAVVAWYWATLLLHLAAFALAAFCGAYVAGRFGPRNSPYFAGLGGTVITVVVGAALTVRALGVGFVGAVGAVLLVVGPLAAALGTRLGGKRRT